MSIRPIEQVQDKTEINATSGRSNAAEALYDSRAGFIDDSGATFQCRGDCMSDANRESRALDWVDPIPGAPIALKGGPSDGAYPRTANGEFDPNGTKRLRLQEKKGKLVARPHKGLDRIASIGTDVHSGRRGKVICAGACGKGFGTSILVDHGNGWTQRYAHLSEMFVSKDDFVRRGQIVGLSGDTDIPAQAQPHLHQELRLRNMPMDPRLVMPLDFGE